MQTFQPFFCWQCNRAAVSTDRLNRLILASCLSIMISRCGWGSGDFNTFVSEETSPSAASGAAAPQLVPEGIHKGLCWAGWKLLGMGLALLLDAARMLCMVGSRLVVVTGLLSLEALNALRGLFLCLLLPLRIPLCGQVKTTNKQPCRILHRIQSACQRQVKPACREWGFQKRRTSRRFQYELTDRPCGLMPTPSDFPTLSGAIRLRKCAGPSGTVKGAP